MLTRLAIFLDFLCSFVRCFHIAIHIDFGSILIGKWHVTGWPSNQQQQLMKMTDTNTENWREKFHAHIDRHGNEESVSKSLLSFSFHLIVNLCSFFHSFLLSFLVAWLLAWVASDTWPIFQPTRNSDESNHFPSSPPFLSRFSLFETFTRNQLLARAFISILTHTHTHTHTHTEGKNMNISRMQIDISTQRPFGGADSTSKSSVLQSRHFVCLSASLFLSVCVCVPLLGVGKRHVTTFRASSNLCRGDKQQCQIGNNDASRQIPINK